MATITAPLHSATSRVLKQVLATEIVGCNFNCCPARTDQSEGNRFLEEEQVHLQILLDNAEQMLTVCDRGR